MTSTFAVTGMTCNRCVRHVDKALREIPGVSNVTVDLAAGRATIEHAGTADSAFIEAITAAGYTASTP